MKLNLVVSSLTHLIEIAYTGQRENRERDQESQYYIYLWMKKWKILYNLEQY